MKFVIALFEKSADHNGVKHEKTLKNFSLEVMNVILVLEKNEALLFALGLQNVVWSHCEPQSRKSNSESYKRDPKQKQTSAYQTEICL